MSSWLYNKLRLGTKRAAAIAETPPPPPCTPNRASYYVPSRDRALPRRLAASRETTETERAAERNNPRLRDTCFPQQPQPQPQPGDIVLDVVARRGGVVFVDRHKPKPPTSTTPPPELRLRPILTRPATTSNSSAAASPTAARARPRFHAAPPRRRKKAAAGEEDEDGNKKKPASLRWVYESRCVVVVKESADPEEDFLASVEEMVAANYDNAALRSPRGLEDLLACYLALNAADHHRAIVAAFRRAWTHLHYAQPPRVRCMHESS